MKACRFLYMKVQSVPTTFPCNSEWMQKDEHLFFVENTLTDINWLTITLIATRKKSESFGEEEGNREIISNSGGNIAVL